MVLREHQSNILHDLVAAAMRAASAHVQMACSAMGIGSFTQMFGLQVLPCFTHASVAVKGVLKGKVNVSHKVTYCTRQASPA